MQALGMILGMQCLWPIWHACIAIHRYREYAANVVNARDSSAGYKSKPLSGARLEVEKIRTNQLTSTSQLNRLPSIWFWSEPWNIGQDDLIAPQKIILRNFVRQFYVLECINILLPNTIFHLYLDTHNYSSNKMLKFRIPFIFIRCQNAKISRGRSHPCISVMANNIMGRVIFQLFKNFYRSRPPIRCYWEARANRLVNEDNALPLPKNTQK